MLIAKNNLTTLLKFIAIIYKYFIKNNNLWLLRLLQPIKLTISFQINICMMSFMSDFQSQNLTLRR